MRKLLKVEIRAEIRDRDGRLTKAHPWRRANSLLRQFIQILAVQLNQAAISITDTGGTARSVAAAFGNLSIIAGSTITTWGIVVGTGNTAVTMTDTKLVTQVTTNVAHAACSASAENPDSSTWRAVVSRAFTNNTGALLSITEVGLYCQATGTPYYICIDRTLYPVSVPSGSAVTLTYRITVSL